LTQYTNWAGNIQFKPKQWHEPRTIEELQHIVKNAKKLRVVGTGHSFNSISVCREEIVSLHHFNKLIELNTEEQTVTIEAGMKYSELSKILMNKGFAIHNLASLPHISVAGAIATATHGSGNKNKSLASIITAFELINANGDIIHITRENEARFDGMIVHLGALGIVTKLTLEIVPEFTIRQYVYENLPIDSVQRHFDSIYASAYSVSLFTNWETNTINQVWLKQKVEDSKVEDLFGAILSEKKLHPITGIDPIHCTDQLGIEGKWYDRLPHFRMDFTPSSGDEIQSEYIISKKDAPHAIKEIQTIGQQLSSLLHTSEIRSIAQDNLWLSPYYKRDSIGLHFTWKDDWNNVQRMLPVLESVLKPFRPRPHWGKVFTLDKEEIQSQYEMLPKFRELLTEYDPNGKFQNDFINTYIF
jgi:alditol oxidase